MAKQNNKTFMTSSTEPVNLRDIDINPAAIANALLRQAVTNARSTGNDIRSALIDVVGLPMWMVDLTRKMTYSNLEVWHRYLKQGYLRTGVTLQEVECMLKISQYVNEELMTAPAEDETKLNNFKTTIETAVVRECDRPQRSLNKNFTPEKGSKHAPGYDGGDTTGLFDDPLQGDLWVFATEIVQWTVNGPGNRVVRFDDLKKLYRSKMEEGDASGIPIQHLKYEVRDWIRTLKPTVQETHVRPDQARRDEIEFYKRKTLNSLREAVKYADEGRPGLFRKLAWEYLGKYSRVEIEDLSMEKRIENEIRRKFNRKKFRVEGKAYLPPMAAGELLEDRLDEKVQALVAKNPDLVVGLPWVIKVYFECELRENEDRDQVVTPGIGILLAHNELMAHLDNNDEIED